MKLIKAIVRPYVTQDVREALMRIGVTKLTLFDVYNGGDEPSRVAYYRGRPYRLSMFPRAQIEIMAHDEDADQIVDTILRVARTGDPGDGHVLIMPVDCRRDIRTGTAEFDIPHLAEAI